VHWAELIGRYHRLRLRRCRALSFRRWCSQRLLPPQSLHLLLRRWCSHGLLPPQSLQHSLLRSHTSQTATTGIVSKTRMTQSIELTLWGSFVITEIFCGEMGLFCCYVRMTQSIELTPWGSFVITEIFCGEMGLFCCYVRMTQSIELTLCTHARSLSLPSSFPSPPPPSLPPSFWPSLHTWDSCT